MDLTTADKGEYNFYAAIVPKEMAEEVMAVYAMHPGVQNTEVLRRWTMTPGEDEVRGFTILTAYSEDRGVANFAIRLFSRTLGEFGMHRGMAWGWWQIGYENTGLKHGVEYQGAYAPMAKGDSPAKNLMEYLKKKFSVSIYINGL